MLTTHRIQRVTALLAVLVLAGCTRYDGEPSNPAPSLVPATLHATTPFAIINATAGHRVTLPVDLICGAGAAVNVTLSLTSAATASQERITSACRATTFVSATVHDHATPGSYLFALRVEDENGTLLASEDRFASLRVLAPGPGFSENDTARVAYVGRLAHGSVFATNEPALRDLAFARTASFLYVERLQEVRGAAPSNVIAGLHEGILGAQAGESRTFTVAPEKAYGEKTLLEREARDERIARDFVLDRRIEGVTREEFDTHIETTGQGEPAAYAVGSTFTLAQGGNTWTYEVLEITDTRVVYRLAVSEGERFTLYPFWQNATLVVAVTDTQVALRTTPTTATGEVFTMRDAWPQMSALVSADDAEMVVRHSPPVGFEFRSLEVGRPAQTAHVVDVTDTDIVVAFANPSPLAGETLTYDVRIVDIER